MNADARRVCLAAFAGAHGVRGEARLRTFTADPLSVADYGPLQTEAGDRHFEITIVREAKPGVLIVRSPQIRDREHAIELAKTRLYAPRERLPEPEEDEFYYEDLIGLACEALDGSPLGRVKAVVNYGAGDLLEITDIPEVNGVRLLPFTKENAPAVDLAAGRVVLDPPDEWI
ncbi:MAG: ribosome maturation factor RimM [Pseudomonadota bacterium]